MKNTHECPVCGGELTAAFSFCPSCGAPRTQTRPSSTFDREYDFIVAGGGLAGCAAAIQAARRGKKTLLLEKSNILGGLATLGGYTPNASFRCLSRFT